MGQPKAEGPEGENQYQGWTGLPHVLPLVVRRSESITSDTVKGSWDFGEEAAHLNRNRIRRNGDGDQDEGEGGTSSGTVKSKVKAGYARTHAGRGLKTEDTIMKTKSKVKAGPTAVEGK